MLENFDYSKMTIQALQLEEKRLKKQEYISAFIIGIMIGVIVYGVSQNASGYIYIIISLFLIYTNYKKSKAQKRMLKNVREAIKAKS